MTEAIIEVLIEKKNERIKNRTFRFFYKPGYRPAKFPFPAGRASKKSGSTLKTLIRSICADRKAAAAFLFQDAVAVLSGQALSGQ